MINKKLAKKIAEHALSPERKQFIDNHIMHPEREWSIGLLIGISICVFGAVWALYTFDFYKNIKVENSVTDASTVVYRASVVGEVLKDFESRNNAYNHLLTELKKQTPISVSSTTVSNDIDGNILESEATSSMEIRSDRSAEVPLPEYQIDPETSGGENDLIEGE